MNSGRFSINLKPLNQRDLNASDVIRRLQGKLQNVEGIKLFMQPVQNITVDDRVSRTQYQYTLEDPDADELNLWTNRFVEQVNKLPQVEDVATDQQTGGLAVSMIIDRVTASRLGIAPYTIDNTLYDAYGQRQINTMYTQLNQYHVILETRTRVPDGPEQAVEFVHSGQRLVGRERRGSLDVVCILQLGVGGLQQCDGVGRIYAVCQHADGTDECAGIEHLCFERQPPAPRRQTRCP